jgi:hypothetical protein
MNGCELIELIHLIFYCFSELRGWLGIPQLTTVTIVTKVTLVTKVACGFPTQSLPRPETRVGLCVKCPLFMRSSHEVYENNAFRAGHVCLSIRPSICSHESTRKPR